MQKTIIGIGVGGVGGFLIGFAAGHLIYKPGPPEPSFALFVGAILAGAGTITGAIAGAATDIIQFLQKTLPAPTELGPEADYQEPTAPPSE